MGALLCFAVCWVAYIAYLSNKNEDQLKYHQLLLWIGLLVIGITMPLLGFR